MRQDQDATSPKMMKKRIASKSILEIRKGTDSSKKKISITYYSRTKMIWYLFWKTSLRWTILLDSEHIDSKAISCRTSIVQSTPYLNLEIKVVWAILYRLINSSYLDEYFAAYSIPVSLWVHFLTVANNPLKQRISLIFAPPLRVVKCKNVHQNRSWVF